MAITLDGTNGVGVGATPSDAKIEAREDSSTSYPTLLKLTNGQNYGYGARMEFAQPLTNGGGIVTSAQIDSGYDGTGKGNLNFRTVDNGSSLQAMSIDSAGRVTMPYQPSFMIQAGTSSITRPNGHSQIVFNGTQRHNNGGHYNSSNGRFTAPVAGYYQINLLIYGAYTGNYIGASIYINGGNTIYTFNRGDGPDVVAQLSHVIYLNVGDYVTTNTYFSTNGTTMHAQYSYFSGHLLG